MTTIIEAPYGNLSIETNQDGLATRIRFDETAKRRTDSPLAVVDQLREYFESGVLPRQPSVDMTRLTPFQTRVLTTLAATTVAGETITYSELAERVGNPLAVRAVATALARNPFLILFPCHRVTPLSGGIGNYAGGTTVKKRLLDFESAVPRL